MLTIFDTETTGLIKPEGNSIEVQPHIIEIFAIQINEKYEIVNKYYSLIKPPIPIPVELTKHVHHIDDNNVRNAPKFVEIWKNIADVFFESHTVVGHNLKFDIQMLAIELMRIGKELNFPFPPIHFCTIEQSMHIKGHRLKLPELFRIATGKDMEGHHKASNDVMATLECFKHLKRKK